MKVKVCGITRAGDAKLAASLGAWAVGFIFYEKSPRFISPEQAAAIASELPASVERVGVFVNAAPDEMAAIKARVGLTMLQLHGDESPEAVAAAASHGAGVIKAVRARGAGDVEMLLAYRADAFLIDAFDEKARGGTGRLADWSLARLAKKQGLVILAGGLTAENVATAIDAVDPDAVDVSSGLESAPGIKDEAKMRRFFAAAKGRVK